MFILHACVELYVQTCISVSICSVYMCTHDANLCVNECICLFLSSLIPVKYLFLYGISQCLCSLPLVITIIILCFFVDLGACGPTGQGLSTLFLNKCCGPSMMLRCLDLYLNVSVQVCPSLHLLNLSKKNLSRMAGMEPER